MVVLFPPRGNSVRTARLSAPLSQVFQASLKVLKMLITQYIPKHKLSKLETTHCVERTLPVLLARTGDSSARLRVVASNFIQVRCAQVRAVGHSIPVGSDGAIPSARSTCLIQGPSWTSLGL